jgi:anti-anti-sigma regulatory factor/HAMP domain-containing protein
MKFPSKKPRAALGLTATLAIAFFTLSAVVLLLSSGLQMVTTVQTQREAIANKQQLIAREASRAVSTFIQEKFSVLATTVALTDLVTAPPKEQKQVLDSLLGPQPAFRQLVVLNARSQEVARSSRLSLVAAEGVSGQLKGDLLNQVKQTNRYISSVYIDPDSSEPLVLIAVPVTTALGDFQGALAAEVNLKFMWDLVDQIKVGETGHAYVADRQGKLIAFSDTSRVLKSEDVSHVQAVSAFIQHPSSVQTTEVSVYPGITGATVMGTYVPLETPDWAVVTELPTEEADRAINRQIILSIGITLTAAILAGLLGVFVARRLAVPLVNLTGTATRITAGEIGLQAAVSGPRETASLASAFNSMTAQLRQTMGSLEQRVDERTVDLQHALDEVEKRAREQEQLIEENRQQRETIREMSVPVLPITDSTLVMPLVGALDTARLRLLQDQALRAIESVRTRTLILDITGVPLVDSQVAQGLMAVVQAARLLGAEVLLVGIRPEVAQAIVGLGVSLPGLRTYTTLQSALSRQPTNEKFKNLA